MAAFPGQLKSFLEVRPGTRAALVTLFDLLDETRLTVATLEILGVDLAQYCFAQALILDIERCSHLIVLYWMDEARRDLIRQVPGHLGKPRGTFALRSPVRPNPIALSVVELLKVDGLRLTIRYIDCRDGTPLIDIKPYFATTDSIPDAQRSE